MSASRHSDPSATKFISGLYVLAVDDFSKTRRVIIDTLRSSSADVDEATNGVDGLDKLHLAAENNVPYDLVFIDIEMPVMDGVTMLRHLREDPLIAETAVIMLTSHSRMEDIQACLKMGVADYIVKPVTRDRMIQAVMQLQGERNLGSQETWEADTRHVGAVERQDYSRVIFRRLETIENLPALPAVLEKIKALTNDIRANSESISAIMKEEPSMMANVLRMANSVMFGGRERIDSLQSAITRLGLNAVSNLAASLGVLRIIESLEAEGFEHKAFCEHSICTGIAMHVIHEMCSDKLDDQYSADFLQLAGLLHDVGKLIVIQFFSKELAEAIDVGRKHSLPLFLAEQRVIGVDHTVVGGWLGRKWNLDTKQLAVIEFHHDPLLALEEYREPAFLCHAANYIVNQQQMGSAGDVNVPLPDQRVFKALGLNIERIPKVTKRVRELAARSEILKMFA